MHCQHRYSHVKNSGGNSKSVPSVSWVVVDSLCRNCSPYHSPTWMFNLTCSVCGCWQCVQKMPAIAFSFLDIYNLKTSPTEINWTSLLDTAVYHEPCSVFNNPASLFSTIKWTLCASRMLSCLQWWAHTTQSSLCVLGSICVCFLHPSPTQAGPRLWSRTVHSIKRNVLIGESE